jgi:hypothetical protein
MEFYGKEMPVFKSSLHIHSNVSDGSFTPDEVIKLYADHGYDVLAFSDHHKTNPVSTYDGRGMTLLSGIEIHPVGPRGVQWHLLGLGVPEDFPGKYPTGQAAVDAVKAVDGVVFCAHPAGAFTSEEVMALKGLDGIEISNTNNKFTGFEYAEACWHDMFANDFICNAVSVDDTHTACDLFGNWTMIAAPDKRPASLIKALQAGHFYSTQGPEFKRISWENGVFEAEFSEAVEVFIFGYPDMEIVGTPGYPTPDTMPCLTHVKFAPRPKFRGKLRCRIRDKFNRCAWTMPITF